MALLAIRGPAQSFHACSHLGSGSGTIRNPATPTVGDLHIYLRRMYSESSMAYHASGPLQSEAQSSVLVCWLMLLCRFAMCMSSWASRSLHAVRTSASTSAISGLDVGVGCVDDVLIGQDRLAGLNFWKNNTGIYKVLVMILIVAARQLRRAEPASLQNILLADKFWVVEHDLDCRD